MLSEQTIDIIKQEQARIAAARGGCTAVVVVAVNGDPSNLEAEINPQQAQYCDCSYCRAGDLTTSA